MVEPLNRRQGQLLVEMVNRTAAASVGCNKLVPGTVAVISSQSVTQVVDTSIHEAKLNQMWKTNRSLYYFDEKNGTKGKDKLFYTRDRYLRRAKRSSNTVDATLSRVAVPLHVSPANF